MTGAIPTAHHTDCEMTDAHARTHAGSADSPALTSSTVDVHSNKRTDDDSEMPGAKTDAHVDTPDAPTHIEDSVGVNASVNDGDQPRKPYK